MQLSSKAQDYVQQVCDEIRWQKAHAMVQEELLAHIEDQREAYIMAGATEEEADVLAVEEMGSPLEAGSHFDKIYRPHIEWNVIVFAGLVITVGMLMRLSLMKAAGEEVYLFDEFFYLLLGLAVMIYGYRLDYTALFQHYFSGKVSGVIWAVLCTFAVFFIFFVGWHSFNGSMGWIVVNGENVMQSYIALLWPIVLCAFICMQYQKGTRGYLYSFAFLLFSLCLFAGSSTALLLLLGTGCILLCYALWKNWFGCSRKWGLTFLLFPFILLGMILRYPHRLGRLNAILNPLDDLLGYGYASAQILLTLEETQLFGSGGKNLLYAIEYIPNLMTDYMLTAAVSHWGWCSLIPLLLAYGMLLYLGYRACYRVKSQIGKMLVVTVGAVWMIQIIVYLFNNFTSLQLAGYPLLFVQGRYTTISNMFLLGLVLSVFKTGAVQKDTFQKDTFQQTSLSNLPPIPLKKPLITKQELEAFLKLEYDLEEPLLSELKEKKKQNQRETTTKI